MRGLHWRPNINRRLFLGTLGTLALTPTTASAAWQDDTLTLINMARADADRRELAIYGSILAPRRPLAYSLTLEESGQWWCNALRGSGWFDHFGWLNAAGYLVDQNGRQISRVWLPAMSLTDRMTFWWVRNLHLGLDVSTQECSENGVLLKRVTAENVVNAWHHGYNADPRKVIGSHYWNLIHPAWTHFGVGSNNWGSGKRAVFGEFMQVA